LRRRALLLAVSPARALSLPLHDALPICRVLGADVDLHSVQAQIPEREVGDHGDRSRRDALPRALMAHPIPDRPRTCRSPTDMAERDVAEDRPAYGDDPRERRLFASGLRLRADVLVERRQVFRAARILRFPWR